MDSQKSSCLRTEPFTDIKTISFKKTFLATWTHLGELVPIIHYPPVKFLEYDKPKRRWLHSTEILALVQQMKNEGVEIVGFHRPERFNYDVV